jgi:hypothetical protein
MPLPEPAQTMVERVLAAAQVRNAVTDLGGELQVDVETGETGRLTDAGEWVTEPVEPLDEDAETALVDDLLREHERGELQPERVDLPPLPPDADRAMLAVVAFYKVVRGLRLTFYAGCDDRPVLFCCRWVAKHTGVNYKAVNRILGELVRAGVLAEPIPFPMRGRPRPGFLYAPGVVAVSPLEVDRQDHVEPVNELADESLVPGAEVAVGDGPLRAARDWTGEGDGGRLHEPIMPDTADVMNAIKGPL